MEPPFELVSANKPGTLIARVVEQTPSAMLVMGAFGHSPIRTVHVPVLLVR